MQGNIRADSLMTGWCHDIRTHINLLMGAIQMIETGRLNGEQVHHYIGMVRKNADAMLRMLNRLLEDSMGEQAQAAHAGKSASPTRIQIDGLLQGIAESVRPCAQASDIELLHDIDSPLYATADEESLSRVLYNLLYNAIAYTDAGGFVYLSATQTDDTVSIHVADTGRGLGQAHIDAILSDQESSKELGIGLSLVKQMMRAMGGTLGCASRERVGTTFYLTLPAAVPPARAAKHTPLPAQSV
jgi:signal transduction histidine kinase